MQTMCLLLRLSYGVMCLFAVNERKGDFSKLRELLSLLQVSINRENVRMETNHFKQAVSFINL